MQITQRASAFISVSLFKIFKISFLGEGLLLDREFSNDRGLVSLLSDVGPLQGGLCLPQTKACDVRGSVAHMGVGPLPKVESTLL